MRALPLIVALAGLVAASPAGAQTKPALPSGKGLVIFGQTFSASPERKVVEVFHPELRDAPMTTALYDLSGNGQPDVIVKLSAPEACDGGGKRCRTMVFRPGAKGYLKVLDRRAETVDATTLGYAGVRGLSLDSGREVYAWDTGGYRLDIGATGKAVAFVEAPASNRDLLISQFGAGAVAMGRKAKDVKVKVASLTLRDDASPLVMARLDGPGACGRKFGCPWRLLQIKDRSYVVVSEGMGAAKAAVMPVSRGGWRDIAVETPEGHAIYGWAGTKYVMAERVEGANR